LNKDWVYLRFVGGKHLEMPKRGPYLSYETNGIYLVPPRNEAYEFWEPVKKSELKKITKKKRKKKVEPEPEEVYEEPEIEEAPPSQGLKPFTNAPPSQEDFITSMDNETLRNYITGHGVKVDKRWGRKRLQEEALKIQ